ncbi:glycosyltransferase [Oryzomonas rubra]|uniref:Glycosyltransferase n=1 Tax=Oryzomonas rubra TaxID=2509454 RepID=A0A5A9X759_9BACT|nr:glycosyltransferase [Oryzomonas rubra]KAA0889012.1 glycosyltransferase [Oryzomonas rubra]
MQRDMLSISVIVPCKDEEHILPLTLGALINETRNGYISEIILVDNQSTDSSVDIARSLGVKVFSCSGNVSQVRNYGAQNAANGIIAFVDADVEVVAGWSSWIVNYFNSFKYPNNIIIGDVYGVRNGCSWVERIWHKSLKERQITKYINGGNIALTKRCFIKTGGFDSSLVTGEDVDFCQRASDNGIDIVRTESMKTIHHGYPNDLRSFYICERWHGLGMVKYSKTIISKPLLLSYFVLSMPISIPLYYKLFGPNALIVLPLPAFILSSRRLKSSNLFDKLKLMILFIIYGFARAHALFDIFKDRITKR